jgi:hypothetical protein
MSNQTDEWIDRLNALSAPGEAARKPLTNQQVKDLLLEHPPKELPDSEARTELVGSIVDAFASSGAAGRLRIVTRLSDDTSKALLNYAFRMATDAVRQTSPDLVVRGLVALVIDGGRLDSRDCIVRMALLHHSALKLEMAVGPIFETVASHSDARSASIGAAMRTFPRRQPENRDISAFHFREAVTPAGFTYEQILPWSRPMQP